MFLIESFFIKFLVVNFIKKQTLYRIFVITLILFTGLGLISAAGNANNSSVNHTNQEIQASNNVNVTNLGRSNDNYTNLNESSKSSTSDSGISASYGSSDEKVYTTTGGIRNISFNNGYNGYCVNMSLHSASVNQSFSLANTSVICSHQHNVPVGEYLKILFYNYWDTVNSDKSATADAVWRFTDEVFIPYISSDYDGPVVSSLVENVINDYNSGFRVDDHGAVKKLNNTTEMVFDFQTFVSPDNEVQSYFGYKVLLRDIINNSTVNGTNITNNTVNNNTTNNNTNITDNDTNITNNNTNTTNNNTNTTNDTVNNDTNITNNNTNTNNNNTNITSNDTNTTVNNSTNGTNGSSINNTNNNHNSIVNNGTNSSQNNKIPNNTAIDSNKNDNNTNNGTGLANMYNTGNPLFFIVAALAVLGLIPFNRK